MRMFIMGMLIVSGIAVGANTVNQDGVTAVAVSKYKVRVQYRGNTLGVFTKDEVSAISKAMSGAARLIKKPTASEIRDALLGTEEGRKLMDGIVNGR